MLGSAEGEPVERGRREKDSVPEADSRSRIEGDGVTGMDDGGRK